jgi:hypothetical protein
MWLCQYGIQSMTIIEILTVYLHSICRAAIQSDEYIYEYRATACVFCCLLLFSVDDPLTYCSSSGSVHYRVVLFFCLTYSVSLSTWCLYICSLVFWYSDGHSDTLLMFVMIITVFIVWCWHYYCDTFSHSLSDSDMTIHSANRVWCSDVVCDDVRVLFYGTDKWYCLSDISFSVQYCLSFCWHSILIWVFL